MNGLRMRRLALFRRLLAAVGSAAVDDDGREGGNRCSPRARTKQARRMPWRLNNRRTPPDGGLRRQPVIEEVPTGAVLDRHDPDVGIKADLTFKVRVGFGLERRRTTEAGLP